MGGVVHRGLVHEDEVLVDAAPAHVEARRALAGRLHPGQSGDDLQDVDLAHKGRHLADGLAGQPHHPHLGALHVLAGTAVLHHHLAEHLVLRLEGHVEAHLAAHLQAEGTGLVAHERHLQHVNPRGQRERIIARGIGSRPDAQLAGKHRGTHQGLARGGIGDPPPHHVLGQSLVGQGRKAREQEQEDEQDLFHKRCNEGTTRPLYTNNGRGKRLMMPVTKNGVWGLGLGKI